MRPPADPCQAAVGEWIVRYEADKLRSMLHYSLCREPIVGGLGKTGMPE